MKIKDQVQYYQNQTDQIKSELNQTDQNKRKQTWSD